MKLMNETQAILANKLIFENAGLNPGDFLTDSFGEKSKECHAQIMDYLCKLAPEGDGLGVLQSMLYHYMDKRWFEDSACIDDPDYQVAKVLHGYLRDIYNVYFDIKDGKVEHTNAEEFVLPSMIKERSEYGSRYDIWQDDMKYIEPKLVMLGGSPELELIITHDGVPYCAPNGHRALAGWLNANGVDLHNAIRLEASLSQIKTSTFSFTSLYNYSFSKSSDDDKYMQVSDKQAEILGKTYDALSTRWSNLQTMEEAMKYTTGFGVGLKDLDEEKMSGNLSTFNRNMDSFNKNAYVADIRRNKDVHNPMS